MKRMILVGLAALLAAGAVVPAGAAVGPEGCQAVNPGQPTCTYTATHPGESPVAGISAVGSWVVKVKVGKKTETIKSPSTGEPTVVEMNFETGAKVSVKTLAPGSAVIVGHVD